MNREGFIRELERFAPEQDKPLFVSSRAEYEGRCPGQGDGSFDRSDGDEKPRAAKKGQPPDDER